MTIKSKHSKRKNKATSPSTKKTPPISKTPSNNSSKLPKTKCIPTCPKLNIMLNRLHSFLASKSAWKDSGINLSNATCKIPKLSNKSYFFINERKLPLKRKRIMKNVKRLPGITNWNKKREK